MTVPGTVTVSDRGGDSTSTRPAALLPGWPHAPAAIHSFWTCTVGHAHSLVAPLRWWKTRRKNTSGERFLLLWYLIRFQIEDKATSSPTTFIRLNLLVGYLVNHLNKTLTVPLNVCLVIQQRRCFLCLITPFSIVLVWQMVPSAAGMLLVMQRLLLLMHQSSLHTSCGRRIKYRWWSGKNNEQSE